jgi:hypothetical protein
LLVEGELEIIEKALESARTAIRDSDRASPIQRAIDALADADARLRRTAHEPRDPDRPSGKTVTETAERVEHAAGIEAHLEQKRERA